ncbi:MAG: RNA-binding S4 domain-containing protein, partial [Limosilactobacillus sp.]|nr:RNA-binding S4 domain-containing protein [Limosilactobacillus sp.]
MEEKSVLIDSPFITLGQLLKEEGIIPTGGAAKWQSLIHISEPTRQ